MNKKELIASLENCPDDTNIWMIFNTLSGLQTYASVDYVLVDKASGYLTDVMDSFGEIDTRLLNNKDNDTIAVIGTTFNPL